MNINTGLNPYNSNYVNQTADVAKMSQNQSLTGSVTDNLKEGEIFEGSVNSIENGKVTIGLANGQTMTARLDSGVSLAPGQSVFFEVKRNEGSLVQIRPVSLTGLDANPTLLKALDMANIAPSERTINMVNTMMQNSMSVSPENLAAMNRAMINNPEVDLQTLVTMSKNGMELSPETVNMFQNYANDRAVLTDNFDVISDMLPELMSSEELSTSEVISINHALKDIFMPEEVVASSTSVASSQSEQAAQPLQNSQVFTEEAVLNTEQKSGPSLETSVNQQILADNQPVNAEQTINTNVQKDNVQIVTESTIPEAASENPQAAVMESTVQENELGNNMLNNFVGEKQIQSFNTILNSMPDFPKDNLEMFAEDGTLKSNADVNQVFREITHYLDEHPDIPKETLNDIIRSPLYKGLLKGMIANSFAMEPKDVTKPGEISKLYERLQKQTEALERLVSSFNNKAADTIKNQTNEIKQNINFMNNANEMYNFVQIPLKMYNQNTDSMLYVKQNKRSSYEAGEEITAYLHFDMEYLGSTDVFISLKESKVGCKWNLASEDSMKLIEDNLDILTERLAKKGFSVSSEVTCGKSKEDLTHAFFGMPAAESTTPKEGLVHRYSFDMRA